MTWAPLKQACTDGGQYGFNIAADEYVDEGVRLLRTTDLSGGRLSPEDGIFVPGPVQERYRLLEGDLLLSRSGTVGRSFRVPRKAAGCTFAGFLVRFRPASVTDSRYLAFAAQSDHFLGQVESDSTTSTIKNFNADRYGKVLVRLPGLDEQRRIADFLDDQVSRIDAASAVSDHQVGLVTERLERQLFDLFIQPGSSAWPLSAVSRIVDTEHRTAPEALGGLHWSAGSGSIRDGRLIAEKLTEIDRATFIEWTRRGKPAAGDVILTREAPVGEVALVRQDDLPLAIGQRVVLIQANPSQLESRFLGGFLLSEHFRRRVIDVTQGSLHPHLNMSDISRLRVPIPSLRAQRAIGAAVLDLLAQRSGHVSVVQRRAELLHERKRALITAAVTGEFDVSSAGPRAAAAVTA